MLLIRLPTKWIRAIKNTIARGESLFLAEVPWLMAFATNDTRLFTVLCALAQFPRFGCGCPFIWRFRALAAKVPNRAGSPKWHPCAIFSFCPPSIKLVKYKYCSGVYKYTRGMQGIFAFVPKRITIRTNSSSCLYYVYPNQLEPCPQFLYR